MADAIVILLLENLCKFLVKKEVSLLVKTNEDLCKLKFNLEFMLCFLEDYRDASSELLNQIQRAAYDAEDVIEECFFSTYEEKKKNWQLLKFGKPTIKRGILKRMKNMVVRTERLCLSIDEKVMQVGAKVDAKVDAAKNAPTRGGKRSPIAEEEDVVGFTKDARILVKRLTGGDLKFAAISIVGMGGLGKTTLAKKVYDDYSIKGVFSHRCWVYVSHIKALDEILLGILKCLTKEKMTNTSVGHLGNLLQNKLKDKKYLIVMDDVWEPQVWEKLRPFFPDNNNGSRIMFTTRMVEVAVHAADSDPRNHPHYLQFLNSEESWELFCNKALPGQTFPAHWKKAGKRIAEKCYGLPLAIDVVGGLLSMKQSMFDEWSRVDNQVSTFLCKFPSFKETLSLSYKELPYYLKPCFLYMSVFPEGHRIPAKQLIHLWIAEGFIRANHGETMEDTAENYLEKLVSLSLIQVLERKSNGRIKTCSVHRLLHRLLLDVYISEFQPENFLQVHLSADFPPRRLIGNDTTIRHLINNPKTVQQLRTLLFFNHKANMLQGWEKLLKAMRYLRVFKVSDLSVVPKEIENLLLLRYFSLDYNSFLQVPSSAFNLPNLQVLDARSQSLSFAPVGFWNLKSLRHAYFQGLTLSQPPKSSYTNDDGSCFLEDLQTLTTISPKSCTPKVFQNIPNLLKLGIKGDLNALPTENLVLLKKLRKLKLVRTDEFPPLISLPIELLPNLTELTLCNTVLKDDPMVLLGSLENLQTLKLSNNVYPGMRMTCLIRAFPKLKHLKLVSLERICQVLMVKSSLPNLESFVVDDCRYLEWLTGVQFLAKLQVLELKKPTAMLRQRMENFHKEQFQLQIYPLQENHQG